MSSNEYPPPPQHGDDVPTEQSQAGAPEQAGHSHTQPYEPQQHQQSYPGAQPQAAQPFDQQHASSYEPAQPPATNSYPAVGAGYQPYGSYGSSNVAPQPNQEQGQQSPGHGGYYPPGFTPVGASAFGGPPAVPGSGGTTEHGRPKRARNGLLMTALIAALIGGGVGGGIVAAADNNNGNSVNTGLKITNSTGAPTAQLNGTVGAAAAKIRPSVVTINVTSSQASGTGSGVIIRQDGYILTNDHVVAVGSSTGSTTGSGGATGTVQVTLSDGRTAGAKIVGRDTSDDLAVIKVDGLNNLTAATFAKSSSLSVGQAVVAVGAPLGLSDTVTSGIVSNLARPVRAGDNDQAVFEAVQTDAAINPGNSGGPLVDLNGSVVGINAAIASDQSGGGLQIPGQPQQQAGNIGIGFAIPADEASRIASELIATGKATHAVLGVSVGGDTTASRSVAGVALKSVNAGGVAAKAGLQVGDIVTAIDGQQVTSSDALIAAVRNHAPGQQVKVDYTRGGKANSVTVTLGSSNS